MSTSTACTAPQRHLCKPQIQADISKQRSKLPCEDSRYTLQNIEKGSLPEPLNPGSQKEISVTVAF